MNERMEQEMIRTIQRLRASMPERKNQQASINTLLRLAREEMNGLFLLTLLAASVLFCATAARLLAQPMLTVFCTAPMPMLLLFHRYVLHGNEPMKELEDTFLYSYAEMLIGRTMVISIYMLGVLACLSIVLHHTGGETFLRLALCGAAPSVYLCVLLLLLAGTVRQKENLSILAVVLWMALVFLAVYLPVDQFLCQLSTITYGIATEIGLVLYAVSICKVKTRRGFLCGRYGMS